MNFCTSCGQPRAAGARFCTSCGASFAAGAGDGPSPAQPEPAQPEPAQPEPAQPDPAQPEPAQPEPAQPEPEFAPEQPWQAPEEMWAPQQESWATEHDAPTPPHGTWMPQQDAPPAQQEAWAPQQDAPPTQQESWAPRQDAWAAQPGAGFAGQPGAQPEAGPGAPDDPFAHFFRGGPSDPAGPPGGYAGPPGPGYGETMAGQPPYPQAGPPWEPPPRRSRARAITLLAGVVVVLVAGGVGAWAALGGKGHPSAQSGHTARSASSTPRSSPKPSSSAPRTSPSPSPRSSRLVAAAPGVTGQHDEKSVLAFLNTYFTAINTHNYQKYYGLLDAQQQQQVTQGLFNSGFRGTRDSRATLVALGPAGGGTVAASVTFTSHQSPSASPSHTRCTDWNTTLYLRPRGRSYVIVAPPASYHATFHAC